MKKKHHRGDRSRRGDLAAGRRPSTGATPATTLLEGRSGKTPIPGPSGANRRWARLLIGGALVTAAVAVAVVVVSTSYPGGDANKAAAEVLPPDPLDNPFSVEPIEPTPHVSCNPVAQPGAPRPWEAGISVSPYSTMNAVNRNVLTVIPIVSWSGVGPDVSFSLYHNSANFDSELDLTRGMGFRIRPDWTTSYSTQIVDMETLGKLVIADDGTQDLYTPNGEGWDAPPGVHDVLTFDGINYTLKHKDQSYHSFDADGLLVAVVDAVGNTLEIERDASGQMTAIKDAADRKLEFGVSEFDYLMTITDPIEPGDDGDVISERVWQICSENWGKFHGVTDPMGYFISIERDADGRIDEISDKHVPESGYTAPKYVFEYVEAGNVDRAALLRVVDPLGVYQEFSSRSMVDFHGAMTHTDDHGHDWSYEYTCEYPV